MFCYQENTKKSPALPCSAERFWQIVSSPEVKRKITNRRKITKNVMEDNYQHWLSYIGFVSYCRIRENLKGTSFKDLNNKDKLMQYAENLKSSLPGFIFGAREFDETASKKKEKPSKRRALEGIHLNGLFMFDLDHISNPAEVYMKTTQKGFPWRVMLAHNTSSGEGLRLVCVAKPEIGNIADNQIELARYLGVKADGSCIDASRTSFAPMKEDIYFIDEEIFTFYNQAFDDRFCAAYRNRETAPINKSHSFDHTKAPTNSSPEGAAENIKWKGYDVQAIIDQRFAQKKPCKEDSNRHANCLLLASDLLILLDGDKSQTLALLKAQPWVQEIMNERDEDVEKNVRDAADNLSERQKKYLSQSPSKEMQSAIKEVCGKRYREIISESNGQCAANDDSRDNEMNQWLWEWGRIIEALFEPFPLLKDICKGLKKNQYPAALFVGSGLLMTLMTRCTYRFYHRPEELRRLNNCTLIIGDPASGKSFATRLYKLLMAPVFAADKIGKEAINAYRELMKTKGANKEKPKKPKVVVRVHPARTSNAQFIQDMVNAVEIVDGEEMQLHMLTFDTELDNTLSIQKGGSWIDKNSLELKAFHNEEDGQAYSNVDSIFQEFNVTWNYIYTGTPIALKKKVNESNFGSGLATRLTCIPLPSTNFEMMSREKTVDFESDIRLKEWAFKLDKMKGELSVQKIVDELYEWTARRMADALENDSKADELLLKRCAYHGLNFAAPFIVMRHWKELKQDGEFWCGEFQTDDIDWQLAELIVNMQYACQKHYFGSMAEMYFDNKYKEASLNKQHQQKTVDGFRSLSEEFTVEDVIRCFKLHSEETAYMKINRLKGDGLVEKSDTITVDGHAKAVYRKTGKFIIG